MKIRERKKPRRKREGETGLEKGDRIRLDYRAVSPISATGGVTYSLGFFIR